jgi:hypothetical protein
MTALKSTVKLASAITLLLGLSACVTVDSQKELSVSFDERLLALESKVNEALRKSSAAKVDAATAIYIVQEQQ